MNHTHCLPLHPRRSLEEVQPKRQCLAQSDIRMTLIGLVIATTMKVGWWIVAVYDSPSNLPRKTSTAHLREMCAWTNRSLHDQPANSPRKNAHLISRLCALEPRCLGDRGEGCTRYTMIRGISWGRCWCPRLRRQEGEDHCYRSALSGAWEFQSSKRVVENQIGGSKTERNDPERAETSDTHLSDTKLSIVDNLSSSTQNFLLVAWDCATLIDSQRGDGRENHASLRGPSPGCEPEVALGRVEVFFPPSSGVRRVLRSAG